MDLMSAWATRMHLLREAEAFEAKFRKEEIEAETVFCEEQAKRKADAWASAAADIRSAICRLFA